MRNLPWRAFLVGLLLALGVGYALRPTPEPVASPAPAPAASETAPAAPAATDVPAPVASPAPAPAASETAPAAPAATDVPAPVASTAAPIAKAGGTLQLDRASFPASGPVRVSLELPVASADDSPRPVRLVSQPDHRILRLSGGLESGRTAATIEVDPGYLQPGTYLVEVQTTEQSHFPLRRYFIIVR